MFRPSLDRARDFVTDGRLDSEEVGYKLEIGEGLKKARDAVSSSNSEWSALVNKGLTNNLVNWQAKVPFSEWFESYPEDALQAMQALWAKSDTPIGDRIKAFVPRVLEGSRSTHLFQGTGTRMRPISVLLMALDPKSHPPFKVTEFNKAYGKVGYPEPPKDADEADIYEHAMRFLDRLIQEARALGLPKPSNRLEAQSVVWKNEVYPDPTSTNSTNVIEQVEETPSDPEPQSLEELAGELHLPVEFLEEIEALLDDKKQVIFQGPPGTGKTYVAQKLARHLAGSEERVTLVQLHPSYAYEDFVQGFRPTLKDQQAGFELRDGPLLRAAELARSDSNNKHFLVIDEINRGNLAKVLGELYFLLEYRDERIRLQYQREDEEDFTLPDNLYIIGTMNTADRSIALVDLALRRRFYFVEFHPDEEPVKDVLHDWLADKSPDMEWVADVVERANELMREDRHAAIGPSYFMKDGLNEEAVRRIWKHSVLPYIEERRFGESESLDEFDLDRLRRRAMAAAQEEGEEQDEGGTEETDGVSDASG